MFGEFTHGVLIPLLVGAAIAVPAPERYVLLVGLDGVRPDALLAAATPTLDRLAREGAVTFMATAERVTSSGPGWSSILTGVHMDKHNVQDNEFGGHRFGAYPPVFSRLKGLRPDLPTASIVTWAPINRHIAYDAGLLFSTGSDGKVADFARRHLAKGDSRFVFVQLDEPDGAGHRHGFSPDVPEYLRAVETADRQVGSILEGIAERPNRAREEWLVIVTTDHGGIDKSHGPDVPECRTVFLIVHGHSARGAIAGRPSFVEGIALAYEHLGVPVEAGWGLDAQGLSVSGGGGRTVSDSIE